MQPDNLVLYCNCFLPINTFTHLKGPQSQGPAPLHPSLFPQLAKSANVPVYLDAGGMEGPLSPEILSCLTLLSPNETELSRLTNMPTENEAQVRCNGGSPSKTQWESSLGVMTHQDRCRAHRK